MALYPILGFPDGSALKNLPAMRELQETWVQALEQEDPLEKGMATHASILACRDPWTEKFAALPSTELETVRQNSQHAHVCGQTHTRAHISK